jgi:hypothetical protein
VRDLAQDAAARAINAQPWEPLPGMAKLRCTDCLFWFASHDVVAERCANCCAILQRRRLALEVTRKATRDAACRDGNSR